MIISHPSISYRWSSVNHRSATGNHPAPTTGDTEILEEALVKQANPRTDQWFVSARGRTRAPARAHYARARDNARAHARARYVASIRGGTPTRVVPTRYRECTSGIKGAYQRMSLTYLPVPDQGCSDPGYQDPGSDHDRCMIDA